MLVNIRMNASLVVTVRMLDTEIVVEAAGDIDLSTVKILAEPLTQGVKAAIAGPNIPTLTVDLRQTSYIDSAGLALLVEARKRLAPNGKTLQVALTLGGQPLRVLRVGRFDTIMTLIYD